jgi:hypothetical protein
MLSRTLRRHRADELEHLVVELKAPKVVIGKNEINQIDEYALAVIDDERFKRENVKWVFWVISDDMDRFAENRILENERQLGTIHRKGNVTIAIKTWAQVIGDNKARLQFFQEKLQHQVDDKSTLEYLRQRYDRFLKGVFADEEATDSAAAATEKEAVSALSPPVAKSVTRDQGPSAPAHRLP